MYSFAQRKDTRVYDEPLYAYYLSHSNAASYHPGAQEVLQSQARDADEVIQMMLADHGKPVAFFKQMTHHLLDMDRSFLGQMHNVILTRNPKDMLLSFSKVIEHPQMQDVGYAAHIELLTFLQSMNCTPIVIDSAKLLQNPERVLRTWCRLMDLEFDDAMLSWEAGPRPEDGVWAPYWYASVHQSTGFGTYTPKNTALPDHLMPLYEECLPLYNRLNELAIE
ncbi:MAG: sulfotransferase family protein [Flavobacteriales bacterium]|nr:sulfotransferase family protein [Flavobacteriales bacterium]